MIMVKRVSSREVKTKEAEIQSFTSFKPSSSNMNVAAKFMSQMFQPLVHA